MQIKVKYQKGVFKPSQKVKKIKEGQELEINIEEHTQAGKAFDFLKDEEDLYSEKDIVEFNQ